MIMEMGDFDMTVFSSPSSTLQVGRVIPSDREVRPFLSRLEGYKTKIKNLHWSAALLPYNEKDRLHVHLDEVLELVSDFQDVIAENYMGLFGVLPVGFLNGVQPETNDPLELLRIIMADLEAFHATWESDTRYIGMINAVEDLLQNLPVKKYLIMQCK